MDDEDGGHSIQLNFSTVLLHLECLPIGSRLKVGAVVMLLQNLNLREGLCNGTCLLICNLHDNCFDAEVLTGGAKHTRVFDSKIITCTLICHLCFHGVNSYYMCHIQRQ